MKPNPRVFHLRTVPRHRPFAMGGGALTTAGATSAAAVYAGSGAGAASAAASATGSAAAGSATGGASSVFTSGAGSSDILRGKEERKGGGGEEKKREGGNTRQKCCDILDCMVAEQIIYGTVCIRKQRAKARAMVQRVLNEGEVGRKERRCCDKIWFIFAQPVFRSLLFNYVQVSNVRRYKMVLEWMECTTSTE